MSDPTATAIRLTQWHANRAHTGHRRVHTRYLHHHFVTALLDDLFGVQAHGGCSCAGPYEHHLLGIDTEQSHAHRDVITEQGIEAMKSAWNRVSFPYFMSDAAAPVPRAKQAGEEVLVVQRERARDLFLSPHEEPQSPARLPWAVEALRCFPLSNRPHQSKPYGLTPLPLFHL
jgi:hypothetical protein